MGRGKNGFGLETGATQCASSDRYRHDQLSYTFQRQCQENPKPTPVNSTARLDTKTPLSIFRLPSNRELGFTKTSTNPTTEPLSPTPWTFPTCYSENTAPPVFRPTLPRVISPSEFGRASRRSPGPEASSPQNHFRYESRLSQACSPLPVNRPREQVEGREG